MSASPSSHGRSIRILVPDARVRGIRYAGLMNWTGQVLQSPRTQLPVLRTLEEACRPGVYVLVGISTETGRPMAYVGEAENVAQRLDEHARRKDWWESVLVLTSKDANLTKGHIRYLEARLIDMARAANRMPLENATAPLPPPLPRPDSASMEEFLDNALLLFGMLGHPFFERLLASAIPECPPSADEDTSPQSSANLWTLQVSNKPWTAQGVRLDEGFLVLKGSTASIDTADYMSPGWSALRDELQQTGELVVDGDVLRFTQDVLFPSVSTAAAIVVGGNRNGRVLWRHAEGRSIKEVEGMG